MSCDSHCESRSVHVDDSPAKQLRSRIFGHKGVIIPFKEGVIAKKCRILQELQFYLDYAGWLHDYLPSDLVPEVEGISDGIAEEANEVTLKMKRPTSVPSFKSTPYLIMHDLADGFTKPAVLDVKLGSRTWAFGASPEKAARMKE